MEESNVSFMHTVLNDYNNWLAKKLISALLMNET